jgi:hypothetical protein
VMADNVMPMRLPGRSWQQPLASSSHDAVMRPTAMLQRCYSGDFFTSP